MYRLILSNRWAAALWAAVMLASIAAFVDQDGASQQSIAQATENIRGRQAEIDGANASPPHVIPPSEVAAAKHNEVEPDDSVADAPDEAAVDEPAPDPSDFSDTVPDSEPEPDQPET
jgi:hypothetical protein